MLESALVLDGIVTVIDAKHFDTQLDEHGHGKQQHEAAMQVPEHKAKHREHKALIYSYGPGLDGDGAGAGFRGNASIAWDFLR
jgi:hypothetical protein